MLKHRWKYWNCSKFADWVRGEKKPYALTMEEWQEWKDKLKKERPLRYYVSEKLLNKLQNFIYYPSDVYDSIKAYIENRFITKTHYLKTGLEAGVYHELDDRIMHGLFNELKEFVECEQARMQSYGSGKDKKYKFVKGKCREAGIDYLNWASELKYDEENYGVKKGEPDYGEPTPQAISAKKILELYYWWENRPNRADAMDESGWSDYCKNKPLGHKTDEKGREALNKLTELEEAQEKEDENMLIELIKVRKSLWT